MVNVKKVCKNNKIVFVNNFFTFQLINTVFTNEEFVIEIKRSYLSDFYQKSLYNISTSLSNILTNARRNMKLSEHFYKVSSIFLQNGDFDVTVGKFDAKTLERDRSDVTV